MSDITGNYRINNNIFFTGAGFTYNFGGFLAKQMWALIFNYPEIQKYPRIKKLMRNDFSYESVYYEVIEGDFNDDERNALTEAMKSSYEKLDEKIRNYKYGSHPVSIAEVNSFVERFAGDHNEKGFVFTLNQDVFFERYCRGSIYKAITLGVPMWPNNNERPLRKEDYVKLPANIDEIKHNLLSNEKFLYVKLHGSQNWKSFSGSDKMVIGKDKKEQIEKEPLLKYYFDCFSEVISRPDIRLFVIGYGFGDKHINEVVSNSIRKKNLKLYVLNRTNPEKFKNDLQSNKPYGKTIWNGLESYYPYKLSTVFPGKGSITVEYKLVLDSYFNLK